MKNSILFNTHDWLQLQPETIKKHNEVIDHTHNVR